MVQLLTALPSTCTVQAPQSDVSQPMCGPGETGHFAQVVNEQQARLDGVGALVSIDGKGDGSCHDRSPSGYDDNTRGRWEAAGGRGTTSDPRRIGAHPF